MVTSLLSARRTWFKPAEEVAEVHDVHFGFRDARLADSTRCRVYRRVFGIARRSYGWLSARLSRRMVRYRGPCTVLSSAGADIQVFNFENSLSS